MRSFVIFGWRLAALGLLSLFGLLGLTAGCGKVSAPVQLYFIGSPRFVAGNRPPLSQPDTLATRLYATLDTANASSLRRFTATVTYTSPRAPFAYPNPLSFFTYSGATEPITYLDTLLAPGRRQLLYTQVFGTRTTAGSERWVFVATDNNGNSSSRAFTLALRRSDSLNVYHDYTLNLNTSLPGAAARRFVQLSAGLALPASAVVPTKPTDTSVAQQNLTDLVIAADGSRLLAPSMARLGTRWTARLRATDLVLTQLRGDSALTDLRDTLAIRQQFVGPPLKQTPVLAVRQVYAFRTDDRPRPTYGLILVQALPRGTTQGLRLRVVVGKQPR